MYYVLNYIYPRDEDDRTYMIEDGIDFEGVRSWALGEPFTSPLPNPITLELVPIDDFQGNPPEMFDGYICLMSTRMVKVIQTAGADNLDVYPAILEDKVNNRHFDYQAVNIVGLMAVADLQKSIWENLDGEAKFDTHFSETVIDASKARGQLIFRMAESTDTIIIHERVKEALETAGFETLRFTKVAEA